VHANEHRVVDDNITSARVPFVNIRAIEMNEVVWTCPLAIGLRLTVRWIARHRIALELALRKKQVNDGDLLHDCA
jgi:hypothetical protein